MSRKPIEVIVGMNRPQSLALLRAINHALADGVKWPNGPDRRALVCAKRLVMEARESGNANP